MKTRTVTLPLAALAGLALAATSASAQLTSQYGILDLTANGGINPNTGVAWAAGDQYRLAFYTKATIDGKSNDPSVYDNFATAQANLSTLGNGLITTSTGWTAMVWVNTDSGQDQGVGPLSSPAVRSGTDDLTGGPALGGAGVPVYVMDGTTAIARNNADIYNSWSNPFDSDNALRLASGSTNNDSDGNPVTASQNVHYSPFLDQFGLGDTANVHGVNVWTGGFGGHVNALGDVLMANGATADQLTASWGSSNANNTGRIWNRFTGNTSEMHNVYAISPLLTVSTGGGSPFLLIITPNGANYDFSWTSQDGKVYDLVTSTDLATAVSTWPVYDDGVNTYGDLAASGTGTNTLSAVIPSGPRRFFAVVEKDAPPPPVPALQNASFEDPVIGTDGAFTSVAPPNWTEFDAGNLGDVGVWNPLVSEHATVPDGANVGQVYHASGVPMTAFGLSQVLAANFAADTAYQVTVEVGRSAFFAWPGYRVELWAGATKIAEEMNTLVPVADSWTTSTLTYTYTAGEAGLVGQPLEIRLLSLGDDPQSAGANFSVEFDKVTFTATPIVP